jgi:hypothetical protein
LNPADARTYATWYRHLAESAMLLMKSLAMDDAPMHTVDSARVLANSALHMAAELDTYAARLEAGDVPL